MTLSDTPDETVLPSPVLKDAGNLLHLLQQAGLKVVTAESCTGGLIAGALTAHPGSSAAVCGGFVTYSNEMKQSCLGVSAHNLQQDGAVSSSVAAQMATGALNAVPDADIAIAVTGIAGPDGGTAEKPVGLVWFGLATGHGQAVTDHRIFHGDRTSVRSQTVRHALAMIRHHMPH